MKKLVSFMIIVLTLTAGISLAQTAAKTPAKPKLTPADIMMCDKEWHVISVEEFAVVTKPPGEKNKTDMLKMTQDGKFNMIMFGKERAGTWTKSGQYIYFVDAATKEKINYKVISVEPAKLKVDHFSDEDGHSIFEYEAK